MKRCWVLGVRRWILGASSLALPVVANGQERQITLHQAVELAQKQGFQATAAVSTRDAARARDRAFAARYFPQLSLNGTAPRFEKTITPVIQPDGSTIFMPVQQTTANAGVTVGQRLPVTGGNFSVTSSLQRYQRTGGTSQTLSWSSSPVTVSLEQPIMRPNGMRWDNREQDVRLDVAERQYLEAREGVALQTTESFFNLYIAKRTLDNATTNAATNDTLYNLNKGRLEIGKIGENDLLQSELALLRARAALDNAKLEYARNLSAFRIAVNLPAGTPIEAVPNVTIPEFEPDTAVAVAQAIKNRATTSELALQSVQARRAVAEARLNNGMGATVSASMGFNQTAPEMNLAYQDLLQAQRFSLGVSIPVIQWGLRSAAIQAARADQRRVEATSNQSREQLRQDAHFAALQFEQSRRNLMVSAKADTVALKRFEVAYNRYVIGRIGIDNLYIAQNEKDQAVNQYLQALRNYWMAYYRLRQTTLYDFEKGTEIR